MICNLEMAVQFDQEAQEFALLYQLVDSHCGIVKVVGSNPSQGSKKGVQE